MPLKTIESLSAQNKQEHHFYNALIAIRAWLHIAKLRADGLSSHSTAPSSSSSYTPTLEANLIYDLPLEYPRAIASPEAFAAFVKTLSEKYSGSSHHADSSPLRDMMINLTSLNNEDIKASQLLSKFVRFLTSTKMQTKLLGSLSPEEQAIIDEAQADYQTLQLCYLPKIQLSLSFKKPKAYTEALNSAARKGLNPLIDLLVTTCKETRIDYQDAHVSVDEQGNTALLLAALYGQTETVEHLITAHQCKASVKNKNEMTILHGAAQSGNKALIKDLIARHSELNINDTDKDRNGILAYAAYSGNIDTFDSLVKDYDLDIQALNNSGATLLHLAAFGGHIRLFDHLVNHYHLDIHAKDNRGFGVLHHAAQGGHTQLFDHLISQYQLDKNAKTLTNETLANRSILDIAATAGHVPMVAHLTNRHGFKLTHDTLRSAVEAPSPEAIEYVATQLGLTDLSQGHLRIGSTLTPAFVKEIYFHAIRYGQPQTVSYLGAHLDNIDWHRAYPDLDLCYDAQGRNQLHYAAMTNNAAVFNLFIDPRSIPVEELQDSHGKTYLHDAAALGHLEVIDSIWTFDEAFNQFAALKDDAGKTMLHYAVEGGHLNVVEYISREIYSLRELACEERGEGGTLLHLAAINGHRNVYDYLRAEYGLLLEAKDRDGKTAEDYMQLSTPKAVSDTSSSSDTTSSINTPVGQSLLYTPDSGEARQSPNSVVAPEIDAVSLTS